MNRWIDGYIAEKGLAYIDIELARAWHELMKRPEHEILQILRMQYVYLLQLTHGRGKYDVACENSTRILAQGWDSAPDVTIGNLCEFVAKHPMAYVYGVFAHRFGDAYSVGM